MSTNISIYVSLFSSYTLSFDIHKYETNRMCYILVAIKQINVMLLHLVHIFDSIYTTLE